MTHAIRSFFAVPVPAAVRALLGEVCATLRARPNGDRVRWVRPDNFHVTVRFLGDVFPNVLPDLVGAVQDEVASVDAFGCRLKDLRLFPNARRPRVIAVGLDAEGHLTELAEAVERGVVGAGLSSEGRGFRAHLTLGRLRGHAYPSVHDDFGLHEAAVPVDRVVLFKSDLRPDGAVYEAIEAIPLRSAERLAE